MAAQIKTKFSYDPEADVLMWEASDAPIDYAKEIGPMVVHFTKQNVPVLVEIIEANKFLHHLRELVKTTDHTAIPKTALAY